MGGEEGGRERCTYSSIQYEVAAGVVAMGSNEQEERVGLCVVTLSVLITSPAGRRA